MLKLYCVALALLSLIPTAEALSGKTLDISTHSLRIELRVGQDGRLYQRPLGSRERDAHTQRSSELYPQAGDGFVWEPALQLVHADGNTSCSLVFADAAQTNLGGGISLTRVRLRDAEYPLEVTLVFRAHQALDLVEQWVEVTHQEPGRIELKRADSSSLLLAEEVYLTHFFGDWAREMLSPITEKLLPGTKVLDSKLGVRASQFRNPSFLLSLGGRASETNGTVLAGSLAWSGSFQCEFENNGCGVRALCGINPFASQRSLAAGERFVTPAMLYVWSTNGLGDMSRKFHRWARQFGLRDGQTPRQVLLNNWEATGFDFDFARIAGLYGPARQAGTELFLLDDGWFGNKHPRTNDCAGLGDWQPNQARLPDGLGPLADEAVRRGLRFGIWIEPEMVNPRSELFERHPDWVIRQPRRELELQRNQLVLDLSRPDVQRFEWNVIREILSVSNVSYAKWDCNRYLTQPGSPYLTPARQSDLWVDYVNALYKMMDDTAKTFPKTELMLCSGGGGRADYGALRYFHEFWPSDNTDPVARVPMQWDYSYFFPAMAMASHVTHMGQRPMHFACCVAMSARLGMDLDLNRMSSEDKATLAGAIGAYKQIRDVTQLGDLYRLEDPHAGSRGALNYVSEDKRRAAVFVFQLRDGPNVPVFPQGLDSDRSYTVRELNPAAGRQPAAQEGKTLSGAEIMSRGLAPSCARQMEASVFELSPANPLASKSSLN
jgi:alpha-galactosidase